MKTEITVDWSPLKTLIKRFPQEAKKALHLALNAAANELLNATDEAFTNPNNRQKAWPHSSQKPSPENPQLIHPRQHRLPQTTLPPPPRRRPKQHHRRPILLQIRRHSPIRPRPHPRKTLRPHHRNRRHLPKTHQNTSPPSLLLRHRTRLPNTPLIPQKPITKRGHQKASFSPPQPFPTLSIYPLHHSVTP